MAYNDNFNQDIDAKQLIDNNQVTYMNTLEYQGIREFANTKIVY